MRSLDIDMTETERRDFGFSSCMGPELRAFVEKQLVLDLNRYIRSEGKVCRHSVRFDWSDSCVEGHRTHWLDGEIENFSGIAIFDNKMNLIADGWMEFIETETDLHVFWWYLSGRSDYDIQDKSSNQIPEHIWEILSPQMRSSWAKYAPQVRHWP